MRSPPLWGGVHVFATVLGIGAMASVLLAFIAALRTLAVRGHEEILVGGLVKDRRVRKYDANFRIRGMLWAAANRQAINDHIADFVRASQMFLGVGITMVSLMAPPFLCAPASPGPRMVRGTVALDRATAEAAGAALAKGVEPLVRRIDEVRGAVGLASEGLRLRQPRRGGRKVAGGACRPQGGGRNR